MFTLTSQKKKMPLAFWIFLGLIIGIVAGLLLMNANLFGMTGVDFAKAYIQPWGTIFLNLLKFIVVPIVMFSIAAGVISMKDIRRVGAIGGKTLIYYMCTTASGNPVQRSVRCAGPFRRFLHPCRNPERYGYHRKHLPLQLCEAHG